MNEDPSNLSEQELFRREGLFLDVVKNLPKERVFFIYEHYDDTESGATASNVPVNGEQVACAVAEFMEFARNHFKACGCELCGRRQFTLEFFLEKLVGVTAAEMDERVAGATRIKS